MATFHCVHCGMPFDQRRNEELCPACDANSEVVFRHIKEYLYEHPGASATSLVNNLGVTLRQIKHYLREERLEVVGDGYTGLKCDACGRSVQTGRLCDSCARDAATGRSAESDKTSLGGRRNDMGSSGRTDGSAGTGAVRKADKPRGISYREKPGKP